MGDVETYFDGAVYNLAPLVRDIEAPVDGALAALYRLVRTDSRVERWAIVNPGCNADEVTGAEEGIGRTLAALHRQLLLLPNGGTPPFMPGISWIAAVV